MTGTSMQRKFVAISGVSLANWKSASIAHRVRTPFRSALTKTGSLMWRLLHTQVRKST
jgi:hypothetical protein